MAVGEKPMGIDTFSRARRPRAAQRDRDRHPLPRRPAGRAVAEPSWLRVRSTRAVRLLLIMWRDDRRPPAQPIRRGLRLSPFRLRESRARKHRNRQSPSTPPSRSVCRYQLRAQRAPTRGTVSEIRYGIAIRLHGLVTKPAPELWVRPGLVTSTPEVMRWATATASS
jgi:hypothetical protein